MSGPVRNYRCEPARDWKGRYVYKYGRITNLTWLEEIIVKHIIYIPRPAELNDPREGRPRITRASDKDFIEMVFKRHLLGNPDLSPYQRAKARAEIAYNLPRFGVEWVAQSFEKGLTEQFAYHANLFAYEAAKQ